MLSEHVSVRIVAFMSECLKIYSRAVHVNAFTHALNLKYLISSILFNALINIVCSNHRLSIEISTCSFNEVVGCLTLMTTFSHQP